MNQGAYILCPRVGEDPRVDALAKATRGTKVPCVACGKLVWVHPCMAGVAASPVCASTCGPKAENAVYVVTGDALAAAESMGGLHEGN